jgi:hypothetical protein
MMCTAFQLGQNQTQTLHAVRYVGYVPQRYCSGGFEIGGSGSGRRALLKIAERIAPMNLHVNAGRIMVFYPSFTFHHLVLTAA